MRRWCPWKGCGEAAGPGAEVLAFYLSRARRALAVAAGSLPSLPSCVGCVGLHDATSLRGVGGRMGGASCWALCPQGGGRGGGGRSYRGTLALPRLVGCCAVGT
jgi:hypothetical protein